MTQSPVRRSKLQTNLSRQWKMARHRGASPQTRQSGYCGLSASLAHLASHPSLSNSILLPSGFWRVGPDGSWKHSYPRNLPHCSALARLIVMVANSKILAAVRQLCRCRRKGKSCSRAANYQKGSAPETQQAPTWRPMISEVPDLPFYQQVVARR